LKWDNAKAVSNEAKHGVPFDYAARVFLDDDRADLDASRNADGEERRKAVGRIEGRLYCVVYTMRGSVCRIISARRANAKETKAHG
jgi:uncharacterized DUF497 family protein